MNIVKKYIRLYIKNLHWNFKEADYVLDNEIITINPNSGLHINIKKINKLKKLHLTNIFNGLEFVKRQYSKVDFTLPF